MTKDEFRLQILRTLQSLGILFVGSASVIVLSVSGVIQDGESIAALSAVMSASMGTHAMNRRKDTDD